MIEFYFNSKMIEFPKVIQPVPRHTSRKAATHTGKSLKKGRHPKEGVARLGQVPRGEVYDQGKYPQ